MCVCIGKKHTYIHTHTHKGKTYYSSRRNAKCATRRKAPRRGARLRKGRRYEDVKKTL